MSSLTLQGRGCEGGQTDRYEDREVECGRLKLENVSQESWVAFLSPRLKDPGKGFSAEPSIIWEIHILERRKPSSSLLITSPRKIQNHPRGLSRPRRSSPGLGSFQPCVPWEHLGWRGPAFFRHSPTPAPSGMCRFYLVLCF